MAAINVSKAGWQNSLRKAFTDFQKTDMNDAVYEELIEFCSRFLSVVVENRLRNKDSHQFTGNLINSIVVILYSRNSSPKVRSNTEAFFAFEQLNRPPIRVEMSAINRRGERRKNAIHFNPVDWQGTLGSRYKPEMATDESLGPDDALDFVSTWAPVTGKAFEICVAYTSEYAKWVEMERKTTGFVNSYKFADRQLVHIGFNKIA